MSKLEILKGGHPDEHKAEFDQHAEQAKHHAKKTFHSVRNGFGVWAFTTLATAGAVFAESRLGMSHMGGVFTTGNAEMVTGITGEALAVAAGSLTTLVGGLIHLSEAILHAEKAAVAGGKAIVRTGAHPAEELGRRTVHKVISRALGTLQ